MTLPTPCTFTYSVHVSPGFTGEALCLSNASGMHQPEVPPLYELIANQWALPSRRGFPADGDEGPSPSGAEESMIFETLPTLLGGIGIGRAVLPAMGSLFPHLRGWSVRCPPPDLPHVLQSLRNEIPACVNRDLPRQDLSVSLQVLRRGECYLWTYNIRYHDILGVDHEENA